MRRFGNSATSNARARYCRRQDRTEGDARATRTDASRISCRTSGSRFAACSARRMLTLTILVTVGLGIGATTAIFSAVNAALLRPLPYRGARPARAHLHRHAAVQVSASRLPTTWRWRRSRRTSTRLPRTPTARWPSATATSAELLQRPDGVVDLLRVLGIRPALGRDFTEADGRPGSPPAVIVSSRLLAAAARRTRRRDRQTDPARRRRLHARRRAAAARRPARAAPGVFRRRAVDHAAATRPVFLSRCSGVCARAPTDRPRPSELRAINRRIFPMWQAVVSGREGDVGHDGPQGATSSATSRRSPASRSRPSPSSG